MGIIENIENPKENCTLHKDITITVCIITKNESEYLDRCLASLSRYHFEIVVADTGSTDNTIETALRYTDKVYHFDWCGDFSKARNYSIQHATGDYILVLDTDEFLCEDVDVKLLYSLIQLNPMGVGRIKRVNSYMRDGKEFRFIENINRLFPKSHYRYEGKIHEQICAVNEDSFSTYLLPITIEHSGYDGDETSIMNKAMRNIELLEEELNVSEEDPYLLYQLGKSWYMIKDYARACGFFSKGLSFDLNTRLEYVIDMVESNGYALVNSGNCAQALNYESIYDEFCTNTDFVFLMGIIYMNNEMFDLAVEEFRKTLTMQCGRTEGVNSYLSYYNIGVIYECLDRIDLAAEFYAQCGNYKPAKDRLDAFCAI